MAWSWTCGALPFDRLRANDLSRGPGLEGSWACGGRGGPPHPFDKLRTGLTFPLGRPLHNAVEPGRRPLPSPL